MNTVTTFLFVTTVALAGCGKEKSEAPATGSAAEPVAAEPAAAEPAEPTAAAEPAAIEEVEVPTEMDFEDDASQAITDKNLEDHIKAYEDELAHL